MSDMSLQQLSQDILSNGQQEPVGGLCQGDSLSGPNKVSKSHFISELAKSNQGQHVTPQYTPSTTPPWSEHEVPEMTCTARVAR